MAIKRPREETKKPASGSGSSLAMAEMPPHPQGAGANHIPPPPPLPPGVYFSPTKEECLRFLNRSIAGDSALPDARGRIFRANLYGESPDALRRRHPPASTREGDHTWWFLSETRFQSQTSRTRRADRRVGAAGHWRLEQSKKQLADHGLQNCFGFYTGTGTSRSSDKTAWLMQEFTSAKDDGAGKQGAPALYRVYVTPHATEEQLRDIYGEEGVKKWPDGRKKPARAMVPDMYFDAIAALLPQGSVRGVGQHHAAPPSLPPSPPAGLLDYHGQHYAAPPSPPPSPPAGLLDYHGHQGHYHHQHQRSAAPGLEDISGQYQQQGPFSEVAPPVPLSAQTSLVAADMPSDNLCIPLDELMGMFDEQPAETGKEEPDWESLDNIVDDDEFNNFNWEG